MFTTVCPNCSADIEFIPRVSPSPARVNQRVEATLDAALNHGLIHVVLKGFELIIERRSFEDFAAQTVAWPSVRDWFVAVVGPDGEPKRLPVRPFGLAVLADQFPDIDFPSLGVTTNDIKRILVKAGFDVGRMKHVIGER